MQRLFAYLLTLFGRNRLRSDRGFLGPLRLSLDAAEIRLELKTDENGWCQVGAKLQKESYELGADCFDKVTKRMAAGMAETLSQPRSGEIDGLPVACVLMLFEKHCSIYAAAEGTARHLFIQDRDAKLLAHVVLSDEERRTWIETLNRSSWEVARQVTDGSASRV
jgi:hypothetical protein